MDLATLLQQFGAFGLCLYLMWRNGNELKARLATAEAAAAERHNECEGRNTALAHRITALEDRQFKELAALTEKGIAGLTEATAAIKRAMHEPVTPHKAHPTINPHSTHDG